MQKLRGEEDQKKVVRADYINNFKSVASMKSPKEGEAFSTKADNDSPLKKQATKSKFMGAGRK